MKRFKSYILVALMGLSVSSCKDFLTLMPLNEVVLENFWTEEKDVESVLMGAYAALGSSDCVTRMEAWGEFRSDNILPGSQDDSSSELGQFINENIKDNFELTTYLCFYKAINYANTVLHFAPEVHKKDPNYKGSKLKANKAEAIAIRSLCYWYLIRSFGDVPYTTIPSIDDTHDFFIGATPFNQVLDSLIYDLNNIKDDAVIHYSTELSNTKNTSRFTRAAIYAMLADLYLWKGDWDNCIKHCEAVTILKKSEYDDLYENDKNIRISLMNGKYPLIDAADATDKCGRAYNEIFGTGNSFESLFELYFGEDRSNSLVSDYYNSGSNPTVGKVMANDLLGKLKSVNSKGLFLTNYDTRYHEDLLQETTGQKNYGIVKYVYKEMNYKLEGGTITKMGDSKGHLAGSVRQDNAGSPNWIVYRYTDVLLMQAEALIMKAKSSGFASAADSTKGLKEAFEIIKAVNDRAICASIYGKDNLVYSDYTTIDDFENLLFDERRRELLFEGKRWYDLVRRALRSGKASDVFSAVSEKYEGNNRAIEIKFSNPNGLFLPINRDEIKINNNLKQNPAYQRTDEVIKKAQ